MIIKSPSTCFQLKKIDNHLLVSSYDESKMKSGYFKNQEVCIHKMSLIVFLKLGLHTRFQHAVAFSKELNLFEPTNVITLKTQQHAVNAKRTLKTRV